MIDYIKNADLLVKSGSHLYGCNVENSDEDLRGFILELPESLLGRQIFNLYETKNPDVTIWGLRQFIHLLEVSSPNTLELLWAPKQNILLITEVGQSIIDNKNMFISKNLIARFGGFAHSEWMKAINGSGQRKLGEQRKEHIAHFGFSVKNAYHAVRILEEGIELLETGNLTFPRPNADILKSIRWGKINLTQVTELYEETEKRFAKAKDLNHIPAKVNKKLIDKLYYEIIGTSVCQFLSVQHQ